VKYTYFSASKGGKFLIRSQFWYNRRSCCTFSSSNPLWVTLSSPCGILDKMEWYWCDKETKELVHHEHFLDTRDKLTNPYYDERWFPIPDKNGWFTHPRYKMSESHVNFWGCIDTIMNRDLITSPLNLLGYCNGLMSDKMILDLKNKTPRIEPHPDVLPQLRKRNNIVVYKEDIEHLAHNVYANTGRPESVEEATKMLDNIIRYQKIIPKVLESYDIPYEMFSLDSGDYKKTFSLDKALPRDSSDNIFNSNIDVSKQVDNYMRNYEKV